MNCEVGRVTPCALRLVFFEVGAHGVTRPTSLQWFMITMRDLESSKLPMTVEATGACEGWLWYAVRRI